MEKCVIMDRVIYMRQLFKLIKIVNTTSFTGFHIPYVPVSNNIRVTTKYKCKQHRISPLIRFCRTSSCGNNFWGLWKYTACEKKRVKVDQFLEIVWKISNLNKSRRLIYKIRNFLTSGFEIYAICNVLPRIQKLGDICPITLGTSKFMCRYYNKNTKLHNTLSQFMYGYL